MHQTPEPEIVISTRCGAVLGKKTILKSDHFPGCQNKRILPHIEGAPNFRQVGSLPVFGVAIPTVEGIRNVLEQIGITPAANRRALWHNMREEPLLYVNGRPFVLREVERPFTNLEYTGIHRARVEQMELRLKEDVLMEADRYGAKIMVSDELPDGTMVDKWEDISEDSVQTPLEVYESLEEAGYPVAYERVPVTDEKSPKERDFDALMRRLSSEDLNSALIFNCQMGRGRTSTGTVIATLIYLRRTAGAGMVKEMPQPSQGRVKVIADEQLNGEANSSNGGEESLRRGDYTVIRSLTRVLEGGMEGKRHVDHVIDLCSSMQNLREAILGYRNSILKQVDEKRRQAALSSFVEYLERYYFLIAFTVYINTDSFATTALNHHDRPVGGARPSDGSEGGFQAWMKGRPELYSILRRLLRRDPMGALGYGATTNLLRVWRAAPAGGPGEHAVDIEAVVAARSGEVLGRSTILKSDHFPGCQTLTLDEAIEGAPNFRGVSGLPVYGTANPTVEGIRNVLHVVAKGGQRRVVWHNMREEANIYINGNPYVLREVERPFKNMLEYTGIDRARVEQMEGRLKEDVLREAMQYNGAIMVNHETKEGRIFDAWEPVSILTVQTPLEVYQSLQREGLAVEYARTPITDGKAPKGRDIDTIAKNVVRGGKDVAFVFNCQMGAGRTTTGMVIGCLVYCRITVGLPMAVLPPASKAPVLPQPPVAPNAPILLEPPLAALSPNHRTVASREGGGGKVGQDEDKEEDEDKEGGWHRKRALSVACGEASAVDGDEIAAMDVELEAAVVERKAAASLGFTSGPGKRKLRDLSPPRRIITTSTRAVPPSCPPSSPLAPRHEEEGARPLYSMDDISVIRKITRLLEGGAECRRVLDEVIDRCDAMQNLREATLHYQRTFNQQSDFSARHAALSRGVEYLERYFMLIVFTAYLSSDGFRECNGGQEGVDSFKAWVRQRPEVRQMKWGMRLRPTRVLGKLLEQRGRLGRSGQLDSPTAMQAAMESRVRQRTGSVLTGGTVLKLYHFPGQKRTVDAELLGVDGAPALIKVDSLPAYALATPTVGGMRAVLRYMGAEPEGPHRVVLTDLREEVVVYVNEKPFVLRELLQHVRALKHAGIEAPAVEAMEMRLKEDILAEVVRNGGRVLLHMEEVDAETSEVSLTGYWEEVEPAALQTPKEMYRMLEEHERFRTDYARIPLTRERFPLAADMDAIQRRMDKAGEDVQFMFISHTGMGGVAYALAIVCLRLLAEAKLHGKALPPPLTAQVTPQLSPMRESLDLRSGVVKPLSVEDAALRAGEYRDILSLVRVLWHGLESKVEVDEVIDRCARAGRLRDDIYYHKLMLEACPKGGEKEDERRSTLTDSGVKALRRYFFLIAFQSYLHGRVTALASTHAGDSAFAAWMAARPELKHMLDNLKLQ